MKWQTCNYICKYTDQLHDQELHIRRVLTAKGKVHNEIPPYYPNFLRIKSAKAHKEREEECKIMEGNKQLYQKILNAKFKPSQYSQENNIPKKCPAYNKELIFVKRIRKETVECQDIMRFYDKIPKVKSEYAFNKMAKRKKTLDYSSNQLRRSLYQIYPTLFFQSPRSFVKANFYSGKKTKTNTNDKTEIKNEYDDAVPENIEEENESNELNNDNGSNDTIKEEAHNDNKNFKKIRPESARPNKQGGRSSSVCYRAKSKGQHEDLSEIQRIINENSDEDNEDDNENGTLNNNNKVKNRNNNATNSVKVKQSNSIRKTGSSKKSTGYNTTKRHQIYGQKGSTPSDYKFVSQFNNNKKSVVKPTKLYSNNYMGRSAIYSDRGGQI